MPIHALRAYLGHMANDLISTAEAAQRARVPRRTLVRMVERGDLSPAMKLDGLRGAYLFDPTAIDDLAQERAR